MLVGTGLVALAWAASWSGATPLAHHSFFPLWLGYILVVDALTEMRAGSSLWTRGRYRFAALFLTSVPLWWLFEALNARLGNWSYSYPHEYSWLARRGEASLAFSTVVPALFTTAELYRALGLANRSGRWITLRPSPGGWRLVMVAGIVMLALTVLWPSVFFPLVWISLFVIVDPLVRLLGGYSIAVQVERGWWGTVWRLFAAGITCGFFWEMWNSRAMPKWTYDIAYAEWFHLFEMPILGYGGYLPFALETYAIVMFVNHVLRIWPPDYFRFDQLPEHRQSELQP